MGRNVTPLPDDPDMKDHPLLPNARTLRRTMTDAETLLWSALPRRSLGHRFRRQQPIGPYIVDFFCPAARLVVEIDGSQHLDSSTDPVRDAWFEQNGILVLRFWNYDVLCQLEAVIAAIVGFVEERTRPSPLMT